MLTRVSDSLLTPVGPQQRPGPASTVASKTEGDRRRPTPATPLSRHRLRCYQQWERVTREHQQVVYAQVAEATLSRVWRLACQLQKLVEQGIAHQQLSQSAKMQALAERLAQIPGQYRGRPLLDVRMTLIPLNGEPAPRLCQLKSVPLLASRPRDELVEMKLGEQWLQMGLPANASSAELEAVVRQALMPVGIELSVEQGVARLSVPSALWTSLQGQVAMRGQGQRLPAGELRPIRLLERFHWQDPRGWRFTSVDEMKQSLPKIQGVVAKLARQLTMTQGVQAQMQQTLNSADGGLMEHEVDSQLQRLQVLLNPGGFHQRMKSLMAQANASRNQTQSLLY
ncbi:hypothetical protein [Ferrimonas sp. SCSIO 43195]|uniref:hypothetical protein n=1 Tax=Ferrimonas sp. SCSIO 43195 TaxID=2822844 RepID=UPI0020757A78|nr:hypothetical protein [Ferrimonas sp. SCSIO 43195]USD36254.1 hypothetical protein J8Z22_14630 [Ferrimonas sp. SCSIO 43195]